MYNNMTTGTVAMTIWSDITEGWTETDKAVALAIHKQELTYNGIVDAHNEIDADDYLVLTDKEADERCAEYIKETLWAFNASFLAGETGIDEEVFKRLSEGYESSNEAVASIINANGGMDSFVEAAIGADGRGHFLSGYDSNENEATYNGTTYYIYRTN